MFADTTINLLITIEAMTIIIPSNKKYFRFIQPEEPETLLINRYLSLKPAIPILRLE